MDSSKRKQPPTSGSNENRIKKSKVSPLHCLLLSLSNFAQGGSGGRWQTPHHKAKLEALGSRGLGVGDMGIWTTCMKGKERQALEELEDICKEVKKKKSPPCSNGDYSDA